MNGDSLTLDLSKAQPVTPTPPPSSGALTLDLSKAQPVTPPPAPNTGGLGGVTERNLSNPTGPAFDQPAWSMARAGVNELGRGIGGILDMVGKVRAPFDYKNVYQIQHPGATDDQADQAYDQETQGMVGNRISAHLRDAANWLRSSPDPQDIWGKIGKVGEQVMEVYGPTELLKLGRLGRLLKIGGEAQEAVTAGSRAAQTVEDLKQAQDVHALLSKNKVVAGLFGLGLKSAQDAAIMGGQTYAHTEDPQEALDAAKWGGIIRAGGEVLSTGVKVAGGRVLAQKAATVAEREAAEAAETAEATNARNALPKITTATIGSRQVPVLESQLNEAGRPVRGTTAKIVGARQQEGAMGEISDLAQQATRQVLNAVNATRPVVAPIEDAGRLLPAPAGTEPFTFTLETTPAVEGTTGEIAQSAAKVPGRAAFKEPQYTTASAPSRGATRPGGPHIEGQMGEGIRAAEGQAGADIRTARTPEGQADVAVGGGILKSFDPHEAEGWLRQLEDFQESAAHGKLSEDQQALIEDRRQGLQERLNMHYSSPYARRFDPVDTESAVSQVQNFGHAEKQIQAAVEPVFQKMDSMSGGAFSAWRNQAEKAKALIRNGASTFEAQATAQERLAEANRNIDQLMTQHAGDVSPADYTAARTAWKASKRLGELHALTERMMNGITTEETARGFTQVMTGNTKALQDYLAEGTNLDQVRGLIGQEGIDNLKSYTELLSKAKTARAVTDVGKAVGEELVKNPSFFDMTTRYMPYAARVGTAATVGGIIGHFIPGVGMMTGAMAGALASDTTRFVIRRAVTDPRVGKMVEYAARNGVNPKVYAPLIARMIAVPDQQSKQPQQ